MTAIEALKQTAAELDQYLNACEDARYYGGPTIYPQSPFSEKWAGNLCKHIRALTAETQGWQPIETAPKNRDIFVWGSAEISPHSRPRAGSEVLHMVFWDDHLETWTAVEAGEECYVPSPTHWMPLPSLPSLNKKG